VEIESLHDQLELEGICFKNTKRKWVVNMVIVGRERGSGRLVSLKYPAARVVLMKVGLDISI
jgi:hypothetical protein